MLIDRRLFAHFDWSLLWSALLIPCLGLVVLSSAGFDPDAKISASSWIPQYLNIPVMIKQLVFLACGLGVMIFAISLSTPWLARNAYLIYFLCCAALIGVLLFGTVVNGSRRWLSLPGFNLQPAEPMKFALILVLSRFLSRKPPAPGGYSLKQLFIPAMIIGIPMALIMKQPDLGSAMVLGAIGSTMIIFMGVRPKPVILLLLVVACAVYPAWQSLHDYQQKRILTLINPEADPLGSGYHIIQSKIAVGSGGMFGKGYRQGTQTQLEFLPEHTTDFIFSVLAEEWGFMGSVVIICAYFALIYKMLRVVSRSKDLFGMLLCLGVTSQVLFHTIINIGMVLGLFPVVGIPLPLFSYGGSSVLSTMFALGIVLGVSMRRFAFANK
jgi:rod shape determining protein RodA